MINERWYLVHSLPKGEGRAELHLKSQGFNVFLPKIQRTVRHARQLKTIRAPLFPRYLFVQLDLNRDQWLSIRSTVGVARLFSHQDGSPVPIPKGVVETLLERTDGSVIRLDPGLAPGQRIRLMSGPFADLVGKVVRLDDADRVRVLLDLMGTAVAVSVRRSTVAPAA
jgi:transcription elongation factor/antiterminator RfaH